MAGWTSEMLESGYRGGGHTPAQNIRERKQGTIARHSQSKSFQVLHLPVQLAAWVCEWLGSYGVVVVEVL